MTKRIIALVLVTLSVALLLMSCESHTHTYSDKWSYDGSRHWHEATCGCAYTSDVAEHTLEDNICTVCGMDHIAYSVRRFTAAIKKSAPVSSVTTVVSEYMPDVVLHGEYAATYREDGSAEVKYEYEELTDFWEYNPSRPFIELRTGKFVINQANEIEGDAYNGYIGTRNVISLSFNVNAELIDKIDVKGQTATLVVPAEKTEDVLGVPIDADASVIITLQDSDVASITISYQYITINAVYSYQ